MFVPLPDRGIHVVATSLVQFLADLRSDLAQARDRAVEDAVNGLASDGAALWLQVEEVTVTLEVTHSRASHANVSAESQAKFWVFASVKGAAEGGHEGSRTSTQTLTLTLRPRLDRVVTGSDGIARIEPTHVDVGHATHDNPLAGSSGEEQLDREPLQQ